MKTRPNFGSSAKLDFHQNARQRISKLTWIREAKSDQFVDFPRLATPAASTTTATLSTATTSAFGFFVVLDVGVHQNINRFQPSWDV